MFHHYFIGGHEQGFAPGRVPRRRGVLRRQRLPDHVAAARRAPRAPVGVSLTQFWIRRARRLLPGAVRDARGRRRCTRCCSCPTRSARSRPTSLAALTYTSNWWLIISHRRTSSEAGRPGAAEAPLVARDRRAVLPALAAAADARAAQARTPAHAPHDASAVALASTVLDGDRRDGSINVAYYATFTRLSGLAARVGDGVLLRAVPDPRPDRAAACASRSTSRASSACSCCCGRSRTSRSRPRRRATSSVFRGGFLLVDIATLLVIAAVVHPRSDVGPDPRAARRCGGSACAPTASTSGTTRSSASPGPASTCPLHGWPLFVLRLALSLSARPSCRTATSRHRSAAARSAGTSRACGPSTAYAATRRCGAASLVGGLVVAGGRRAGREPREPRRARRRRSPASTPRARTTGRSRRRRDRRARHLATRADAPRVRPTTTVKPAVTSPHRRSRRHADRNALANEVLAIGDSVMLGAVDSLGQRDPRHLRRREGQPAVLGRHDGVAGVQERRAAPADDRRCTWARTARSPTRDFDRLMAVIGPKRKVVLRQRARAAPVGDRGEPTRCKLDVERYPNARLLDWHNYGGAHDDWFVQRRHPPHRARRAGLRRRSSASTSQAGY